MYTRLFCSCLWIQSVLCNLHSKFKEFDELTPDNFTVVVKRDAMSGQVRLKIVTLFALRKYFVLHLVPGSPVLRKDFEAHMVDADGRMTPVHVDHQIFYTGYLNDNPQHSVDAVHTDHLWIAQIHGPDDVYSIEPLTHHVPDSPTTSMLIFRQRDINSSFFMNHDKENATLQPFCEEVQFKQYPLSDSQTVKHRSPNKKNTSAQTNPYRRKMRNNESAFDTHKSSNIFTKHPKSETYLSKDKHYKMHFRKDQGLWRRSNIKRDSPMYDTCEMLVIADFEIYKGIGRMNIIRMTSILVYLYQSIDRIYRNTSFDSYTNLGIVIASLIVHTEYTNMDNHYNMPNNRMNTHHTLYSMFKVANFSNYCLVHLTTQRSFGGTMGVATPASADVRKWGLGICGTYPDSRNVGFSTPMHSEDVVLPVARYLIVVAHEIGHNWGSLHDPEGDPECNPPSQNGGAYMMSVSSGLSASVNSMTFSPCSRRSISKVLKVKAHMCFKPRELAEEVCGNNIVEPEEDCDVGYLINDPCCTRHCRFSNNAVCSPFNHPCCTNSCQIAPPTQKCVVDIQDCHQTAFCSGTESHTCPQPQPLPNNSTCQSLGKCWHGKCVSFCEMLGATFTPARRLVDCTCSADRITMCDHCCWNTGIKEQYCTKMGGSKINGTPCMLGTCENGVCIGRQIDDTFVDVQETEFSISSRSNTFQQLGHSGDALQSITAIFLGSLTLIL